MELHSQIKKYRIQKGMSQEETAQKIYVTRQTISNWETEKSYPDIHSLLLLSALFEVSLDQLIKGDVETMKKEINAESMQRFNHDSTIFAGLLILSVLLAAPLIFYLNQIGMILEAVLLTVTFYYALKVEKHKKENDIQTYKEIVAFCEGKQLDEITKNREYGKRNYQKWLLAVSSALITATIMALMFFIFSTIS